MDMTLAVARWTQWAWSCWIIAGETVASGHCLKYTRKLSLFSENFGTIASDHTPFLPLLLLTCHFCYFVISAMTSSRGITPPLWTQHLTCFSYHAFSVTLWTLPIMHHASRCEYMLKLTLKSKWFVIVFLWPWSHPSTELHISSRKGPTGSCGQRNKR